jgi:hypothetical protein
MRTKMLLLTTDRIKEVLKILDGERMHKINLTGIMKLDTREIRAVVNIMNLYSPDLYMDIHVTDGADYQYDITFGGIGLQGNSRYC